MDTAHGTWISTQPVIFESIGNSRRVCVIHWNNFRYVLPPMGVGVVHSLVAGAHTACGDSYAFDKKGVSLWPLLSYFSFEGTRRGSLRSHIILWPQHVRGDLCIHLTAGYCNRCGSTVHCLIDLSGWYVIKWLPYIWMFLNFLSSWTAFINGWSSCWYLWISCRFKG